MSIKRYVLSVAHPDYPGITTYRGNLTYKHFHQYWEKIGELPDFKKEDIIHLDSNRENNKITNLKRCSLEEKYSIKFYTLLKSSNNNRLNFNALVADNIRYERFKANKTMLDIEKITDLKIAMQSHFENPRTNITPRAYDMVRLANVFGCDVKALYYPF